MKDFTLSFKRWSTGKVEVTLFQGPALPGLGKHILTCVEPMGVMNWTPHAPLDVSLKMMSDIEELANRMSRENADD